MELFLRIEAARGAEMTASFIAADPGDGSLAAIGENVRSAADLAAEIEPPRQGLPVFTAELLRLLPFIDRPMPLCTQYLARLPAQQAPAGFQPKTWTEIIRPWGRRLICSAINGTADREFDIWYHGSTNRKRQAYICLGVGCGVETPCADGIGSYNSMLFVYEQIDGTDHYGLLDYQREGRTHWTLAYLLRYSRYDRPALALDYPRRRALGRQSSTADPRVA